MVKRPPEAEGVCCWVRVKRLSNAWPAATALTRREARGQPAPSLCTSSEASVSGGRSRRPLARKGDRIERSASRALPRQSIPLIYASPHRVRRSSDRGSGPQWRPYAELERPRQAVGTVLESAGFHPACTGRDHLRVVATVAGIPLGRVDELLPGFIASPGTPRVGSIAAATAGLAGDPKLDRPLSGVVLAGGLRLHGRPL